MPNGLFKPIPLALLVACLLAACASEQPAATDVVDTTLAPCSVAADCDDANPCTEDRCGVSGCLHTNTTGPCDDGNPCTADDTCAGGVCTGGTNACTCAETADCAQFEDGNLCNGTLICQNSSCVQALNSVVVCDDLNDTLCSTNTCAPLTGTCALVAEPDSTSCDDFDTCTTGDHCGAGVCGGSESCCDDQADNDGDGQADCLDSDCANAPSCTPENCTNGVDDDGDTLVDCLDDDCQGAATCRSELCDNHIDDDGDGDTDCLDSECVGDSACGTCPFVAAPELVPDSPLPGEAAPGNHETLTVQGFTDDYQYNGSGQFKVGTRRDWGGTIVFFGIDNGTPGPNNTNVIDANDTGREVQVAFYDPDRAMQDCAHDASCATSPTTCPFSITYLGWNPVQGGNRCNVGSGVESVDFADGAMTAQVLPLFWNPNWDRSDCSDVACNDAQLRSRPGDVRVFQRLRFVREHVVELDYTVQNLSSLAHGRTAQEFPTVYTANGNNGPDLWRLFDSNGVEIAIDTPANDGFFYKAFSSPGGWVAMQNSNLDYGVGLATENRLTEWQGWQLRSLPFNNFRPVFPFAIAANGTIRARSYLILGSRATVASEATWLDQHLPPFGVIDGPVADEAVSGTVTVRGWALDNKGVDRVEVTVDGGAPTTLSYGGSRPDVCAVWPGYAGCPNVGYTGTIDLSAASDCAHLLEVRAVDGDGNARVIGRQRVLR
ncbi:MAG: hypothetical protein AUK47_19610 [Deltaproteobacteria bacterium CG2_30_63_29]|nr:MAG: hypothetical protein AUK47_19610 [Deltaproteobacteria bacterium CG2_30_63_29]PJB42095.1 MAG: hypothetical protein CO108_12235 [Deltaproteobacteria bacterium CG_4_9_14_3_um_filter_63_12]